jgi:SAM-dependent methyltransferase
VVADLGAGTGYFTRMLSALVGETGKVYAVDIEPGMLAHIRAREDLPGYDNIVTVLAEPNDPKLPDGALDLILTVNTWHHLSARKAYLERLDRALRPHGRLAIVDWRAGELPMGPPPGEKVDRDTIVAELEGAGWTLISESVALPYQNALVFQKPER